MTASVYTLLSTQVETILIVRAAASTRRSVRAYYTLTSSVTGKSKV